MKMKKSHIIPLTTTNGPQPMQHPGLNGSCICPCPMPSLNVNKISMPLYNAFHSPYDISDPVVPVRCVPWYRSPVVVLSSCYDYDSRTHTPHSTACPEVYGTRSWHLHRQNRLRNVCGLFHRCIWWVDIE